MSLSLSGTRVLVTRPAAQARGLCDKIAAAGGQALCFPTMEIVPVDDPDAARRAMDASGLADLVIFISANAVVHGIQRIASPGHKAQVAAVGPATLAALQAQGVKTDIEPQPPFNTEALLQHAALQEVRGKNILIVRGEGGRETLAEQLRLRGARVDYAQVYRRRIPEVDSAGLIQQLQQGDIDVITVSSNQILENLLTMLGPQNHHLLRDIALLAWGRRIMSITDTLNLSRPPLIAVSADDNGALETLGLWAASKVNT